MNKILSIIVPVYNEVKTVLIVLKKLKNLKLYNNYKSQIIVVDDNSNDGTMELLHEIKDSTDFKDTTFIFKKKNMGKGDSQKIAIPLCEGDFTIIQDADLEYNVENINSLLRLIIEKNVKLPAKKSRKSSFTLSNIISIILVIIISFIGLIIFLDTFKSPLIDLFPSLELLLFNLFETLKDIFLFTKNLIL